MELMRVGAAPRQLVADKRNELQNKELRACTFGLHNR